MTEDESGLSQPTPAQIFEVNTNLIQLVRERGVEDDALWTDSVFT